MKKINGKHKNVLISVSLLMVAIALVVAISSSLNSNNAKKDTMQEMASETAPRVEEIEAQELAEEPIEVPKIKPQEFTSSDDEKAEVVIIDVPMPTPPEKPELEAPEVKPITNDDTENMDKIPEYKEEELFIETDEVVIIIEENKVVVPVEEQKEVESNLVPPSENPFANPANAGNPVEIDGSELSDHIPGTGDKF